MDKNEAVVRVLNNKKGDDDFTKYRYLHILKTNIAKYRSTSVSECNFDKPAYFLAIGFIRFSKNV